MSIEIFLVKGSRVDDITESISQIQWSGEKSKAPRTLTLTALFATRGYHDTRAVQNGDGIIFRKDGEELFQGIVFQNGLNGKNRSITVYDQMVYLAKNKDSYVFTGQTADQWAKKLCSDFDIPVGGISPTGYAIPYRVFDNSALYDMVMTGLTVTYKQTGRRYSFFSRGGKVYLSGYHENVVKWVVEAGTNLVDYELTNSIEDTITQVKLEVGQEGKTFTVVAKNDSLIRRFGVLQKYEKVSDEIDRAQATERADTMLDKEGQEKRTFKLDNLPGIADVVTGCAIYVIFSDLGIKQAYYVESDSHTFEGRKHTMSLTLTETDDIVEVDEGKDTDGSEKKTKKGGAAAQQDDPSKDWVIDDDVKTKTTGAVEKDW